MRIDNALRVVRESSAGQTFMLRSQRNFENAAALKSVFKPSGIDALYVSGAEGDGHLHLWQTLTDALIARVGKSTFDKTVQNRQWLAALRGPAAGVDGTTYSGLLAGLLEALDCLARMSVEPPICVLHGLEHADALSIDLLNAVLRRQRSTRVVLVINDEVAQLESVLRALSEVATDLDVVLTGVGRADGALLQFSGGGWTLRIGDRRHNLGALTGCELLAQLLSRPSSDIHVLDLTRALDGYAPERATRERDIGAGLSRAQEVLDATAITAYRARLEYLTSDPASSTATAEIEFLQETLRRDMRPDGHSRAMTGDAERGRVRVRKALRRCIDRIAEVEPDLADELWASIGTGVYCCFNPTLEHTPWRVQRND